jgi:hypothetical protein
MQTARLLTGAALFLMMQVETLTKVMDGYGESTLPTAIHVLSVSRWRHKACM